MHLATHAAENAGADRKSGLEPANAKQRFAWRGQGAYRRRRRAVAAGRQQRKGRGRIASLHRAQPRYRGEECLGIGVARRVKNLLDVAFFDFFPPVHDDHPVRDLGNDAHVVCDENDRHAHFLLQQPHQLEDLRLNGDVERRRGLVGDEQLRLARQRHGDHHALAHSPGKLVRVAAHLLEHAQCLAACRREILALMQTYRFGDLLPDGEHGVERGHRLLEDHRDFGAANLAHDRRARLRQVKASAVAGEEELARGDAATAVLDQAHQRERGHRFSRARFADDGDSLAAVDAERHVAHRGDHALGSAEFHRQPADGKQCGRRRSGHRMSTLSRLRKAYPLASRVMPPSSEAPARGSRQAWHSW